MSKMMMNLVSVTLLTVLVSVASARAQTAPLASAKPITVVIPYPPGASADSIMRLLNNRITEKTGQRFVVENRGGAGGTVAAMSVKTAEPDGTTLFQANVANIISQALSNDLPYDLTKDFEPITTLWHLPLFLAVPASSPAKTVSDLVALSKSKPSGITFASPSVGTGPHLLPEMIKAKAGGTWTHVPYRGANPALVDLIAGRVDMMFVSYASVGNFMQENKIRVLAGAMPQRMSILPDVPTMAEAGFPEVQLDSWFGLVAPRNTPAPVIAKLRDMYTQAVHDPGFVKAMDEQGVDVKTTTSNQFKEMIMTDNKRLRALASVAGVALK